MWIAQLPFAASTHLRPNQKITSLYRLTFPSKYWGDVSPAARDLVERILVLNPRKRFTAKVRPSVLRTLCLSVGQSVDSLSRLVSLCCR